MHQFTFPKYCNIIILAVAVLCANGLRAQVMPLPQIIQFNVAQLPAGEVHLNWAVQQPEAGTQYTVQRSVDGVFFSTLGTINGSISGDYCFTDSFPATTGRVWYHILQSNADGITVVTPMRCVLLQETTALATRRRHTVMASLPRTSAATAAVKP